MAKGGGGIPKPPLELKILENPPPRKILKYPPPPLIPARSAGSELDLIMIKTLNLTGFSRNLTKLSPY